MAGRGARALPRLCFPRSPLDCAPAPRGTEQWGRMHQSEPFEESPAPGRREARFRRRKGSRLCQTLPRNELAKAAGQSACREQSRARIRVGARPAPCRNPDAASARLRPSSHSLSRPIKAGARHPSARQLFADAPVAELGVGQRVAQGSEFPDAMARAAPGAIPGQGSRPRVLSRRLRGGSHSPRPAGDFRLDPRPHGVHRHRQWKIVFQSRSARPPRDQHISDSSLG